MLVYQRAVPVLQVVDVEKSLKWYRDVLGFAPDPFPEIPPHSFAMLRKDGAEIMLQAARSPRRDSSPGGGPDPELLWTVYLRIAGSQILEVAAEVGKKAPVLRGPERMIYGMVELEMADPDGYRVCLGGEAPAGASVPMRRE
jgi:catechol 2,3-dioxygenase-like lactoylglutathione lyase family enzyme